MLVIVACCVTYFRPGSVGHPTSPPSAIDRLLALNCLLLGEEPSHTIAVEIQATKTVATLKEEIWKKKPITLKHLEADNLILWKVRRLYIYYHID